MSACRRGTASDLARASANAGPMGLTRISLTFHSAPSRTGRVDDALRRRRLDLLTDGPDEAGEFARNRGDHYCRLLAAGGELAVTAA